MDVANEFHSDFLEQIFEIDIGRLVRMDDRRDPPAVSTPQADDLLVR